MANRKKLRRKGSSLSLSADLVGAGQEPEGRE